MTDSVSRTGKNYYPQVFLKNISMLLKKKKIHMHVINDIEISSDSDEENCTEENSDEKNSDEEN